MPSISVTNPEVITKLDLGTTNPKLGGTVDLSSFKVLSIFDGASHDLANFQNYNHITTFTSVELNNNKLVGDVPDLSASANCALGLFNNNNLDGTLPTTLPAGIMVFRAGYNNLEKSDTTHFIPDLSGCTKLAEFDIQRQSTNYGASQGSSNWGGPGKLANEATTTAAGIEGAIPESMRIFMYVGGNLRKDAKRILLTQFYDTFKDKGIVTAGSFISNRSYKIVTTGTTDFTLLGAADSNVDTTFVANGAGSGTGTARDLTNKWARTTAVNGVTYNSPPHATPKLSVWNNRGTFQNPSTEKLLGKYSGTSGVTIEVAIQTLVDVGFNVVGI